MLVTRLQTGLQLLNSELIRSDTEHRKRFIEEISINGRTPPLDLYHNFHQGTRVTVQSGEITISKWTRNSDENSGSCTCGRKAIMSLDIEKVQEEAKKSWAADHVAASLHVILSVPASTTNCSLSG